MPAEIMCRLLEEGGEREREKEIRNKMKDGKGWVFPR